MKKNIILIRDPLDFIRETKFDIHKVNRNFNPKFQKFSTEIEYQKALNAVKVKKMLSKPFIRCLDGALDEVTVLGMDLSNISLSAFGTADGKIQYWNISENVKLADFKCHDGFINGLSHFESCRFMTCGSDKVVNEWDFRGRPDRNLWREASTPVNSFSISEVPQTIDCQISSNRFLIGTQDSVQLFSRETNEPIGVYGGKDRQSINRVKWHPSENDLFCALSKNNKVQFYDCRGADQLQSMKLTFPSNGISFNPRNPVYFVTASYDFNCYSFDIRNLKMPCRVHEGHTKGVNDVCYASQGHEFVSASVDKTIRIFPRENNMSREIYQSRQMTSVLVARYSCDDQYILSSSGDSNVRLWKADAAKKLGPMNKRQQHKYEESQLLQEKFIHHPEIGKIANTRRVRKSVKNLNKEHRIIRQKEHRKDRNTIKNYNPDHQIQTKKHKAMAE